MSGPGLTLFKILARPLAFLRSQSKRPSQKPTLFIAHRGASQLAPENSLSAFEIALESEADMIEFDVHVSADGIPIVIHDSNLMRTVGVDAEVENLTLAQIKQHPIPASKTTEFVLTLDEVLQLIGRRKKLLVELKSPAKGIYPQIVENVLKCIDRHKAADWIILQSFEPEYLQKIVRNHPSIECHQLIEGTATFLPLYYDVRLRWNFFKPIVGVKAVNLNHKFLSDRFVKERHREGLKVFVYTPNDTRAVGKCAAFGVDGVITDNLSLIWTGR